MDRLKASIARVAPLILIWAMGLITYYIADNTPAGFQALASIMEVMK